MTPDDAEDWSNDGMSGVARQTKVRLRSFARGFRRRCSNLAWMLGGFAATCLCASALVGSQTLPDWFGVLIMAPAAAALVTVTVSAVVSKLKGMEQRFGGIGAQGEEGVELMAKLPKTLRFEDIQGVIFSGKMGWVVLRGGELLHLLFFRPEDAQRAEKLFPPWLRKSPIELVPVPVGARYALGVFFLGSCLLGAVDMPGTSFSSWFGLVMVVLATSAFWLRGRKLVVASDGIAVGRRFYSLDRLTKFSCTSSAVNWTHAGKGQTAKVRLPEHLAVALHQRVNALIAGEAPLDDALERREGEDVHAWLKRVTGLFRGGDFRAPALSKERVLAAAHGKGPLRVRVAVLAALKDRAELVEALGQDSADPRFLRALEVVDDDQAWREVVDALERRGDLEADA